MKYTRCKFYDDDGKPVVPGGCWAGHQCRWAHPDESHWRHAGRKLLATARPPNYRDDNRSRDRTTSESGWDPNMWKSKPKQKADVNPPMSLAKGSDKGWGGSGWGSNVASDSGWGAKGKGKSNDTSATTVVDTNDWGSGGGWGSTGGWGDPEMETQSGRGNKEAGTSSGGWGNQDWGAGWGTDANKTTKESTGGWGDASNIASGSGSKGKEKEDTGGWGNKTKETDGPSKPAALPFRPPLQVNTQDIPPPDQPPQSAFSFRATSVSLSERNTIVSSSTPAMSRTQPLRLQLELMNRAEVNHEIIKNFVRVVQLMVEDKELQRRRLQWKPEKHSGMFTRVSKATGQRLDSTLPDELKVRLSHARDALLAFPELPALNWSKLDRDIASYAEQLAVWEKQYKSGSNKGSTSDDVDMPDVQLTLQERIQNQIRKIIDLQDIFVEQSEITPAEHVDQVLETIRTRAAEETQGPIADLRVQAKSAGSQLELAGANLASMASDSGLETRVEELGLDKQWERQQALEAQLAGIEQQQQLKRTRNAEMLRKLNEYAQRKSEPPPSTLDPAVEARVQEHVTDILQREIQPALEAAAYQYSEALARRMRSLAEVLNPVDEQVEAIRARGRERFEPSPAPI
ncbi:C3H1-type domain-containing protein [Mycena indigotica]|uniref:C3H1-type domain-containing protein n=1 Tax=Mycena indigotica TaxID=2126181 RepID=A0A8H6SZH3_9AGAR|nr:C3H1-type domain-containing protein [Mycena indigotica]KAF7307152.1 C3H1-type domain-containing protein [Mycena indigotica]